MGNLFTRFLLVLDWIDKGKNGLQPARIKFLEARDWSVEEYVTIKGVKYRVYDVAFNYGGDTVIGQNARLCKLEDEEIVFASEES